MVRLQVDRAGGMIVGRSVHLADAGRVAAPVHEREGLGLLALADELEVGARDGLDRGEDGAVLEGLVRDDREVGAGARDLFDGDGGALHADELGSEPEVGLRGDPAEVPFRPRVRDAGRDLVHAARGVDGREERADGRGGEGRRDRALQRVEVRAACDGGEAGRAGAELREVVHDLGAALDPPEKVLVDLEEPVFKLLLLRRGVHSPRTYHAGTPEAGRGARAR